MEKKCKNKKCKRSLPNDYKHKYCEACRNKHAENINKFGKGALAVVAAVGSIAVAVVKGRKG